jgi:hypothetical protein
LVEAGTVMLQDAALPVCLLKAYDKRCSTIMTSMF